MASSCDGQHARFFREALARSGAERHGVQATPLPYTLEAGKRRTHARVKFKYNITHLFFFELCRVGIPQFLDRSAPPFTVGTDLLTPAGNVCWSISSPPCSPRRMRLIKASSTITELFTDNLSVPSFAARLPRSYTLLHNFTIASTIQRELRESPRHNGLKRAPRFSNATAIILITRTHASRRKLTLPRMRASSSRGYLTHNCT